MSKTKWAIFTAAVGALSAGVIALITSAALGLLLLHVAGMFAVTYSVKRFGMFSWPTGAAFAAWVALGLWLQSMDPPGTPWAYVAAMCVGAVIAFISPAGDARRG